MKAKFAMFGIFLLVFIALVAMDARKLNPICLLKNDSSLSSITIRSGNGWRELNLRHISIQTPK